MLRRSRALPADVRTAEQAFFVVVGVLEPAKAGLSDVLPGTRMPGRPLADALAAFVEGLERAVPLMPAWQHAAVQEGWLACDQGLTEALARARRLRQAAPDVAGFEGLLGLVESLLDPLDPFADAEAVFRDLRTGRRVRSH